MDKTVIIQPESGLQFDWKAIAIDPSAHHEPKIDLVAYKALYINKIANARALGHEPVLVSLPIMDENRYFAYITRGMSMQERKNILLNRASALYPCAVQPVALPPCVHAMCAYHRYHFAHARLRS